ncbi:MAG: ribosomal L7Ae/L30e/S12e/Gadd45 family protein [Thermotogota bacterium]|nr:ribosomal L7Ae/L30e/S12e/Gadd45 family protein [Thermotogota bacterium]
MNLLGICKKSGNIVFGKEPIKKAIYNKKNIIVVLAEDAGKSLRDYLLGLCKRENVVIIILKDINKKRLGKSIGKSEISAVGVTDRILANKILKKSKSGGVVSVQDPCI